MNTDFVNATRTNFALTAGLEKRVLVWIAERTPAAINPDHFTALAFVAQLAAGAFYALASHDAMALWFVNLFIAVNWLGDSLDGTLARVRNRLRPRYGFYVDHIVDTFGASALMAGIGCSGYVHWQIAAGMLVCFYALSIESYLATYTMGRFQLSHGVFGPTEIRILLVLGNVRLLIQPYVNIVGHRFLLFDVGGMAAVAGMTIMVVTAAVRHTVRLYREEAF
jgi:archaetidylinositol phosphate synthase